jgi:ACS family hexuronate transporter-like MFS transporter
MGRVSGQGRPSEPQDPAARARGPGATRFRHLRWGIVALICCGTILSYLARNSLAVLAPQLKTALGVSTQQYSYVVGAFQLAYTVMQPVCGFVVDRIGLQLGFALFAAAWSIANILHALAEDWRGLAVFRALLGSSEAALIPAGMKAISEWFPLRERSVATGWFNVGTAVGAMIAPPVVIGVSLLTNWRVTPEERDYILAERPPASTVRANPLAILGAGRFWAIAVPRFLIEPAWQTFSFWIPLYLAKERGMDLGQIALFAWTPFLAADFGGVAGGYLSPFVMRTFGMSLAPSRIVGVALGAVLMIAPGCVGLATSPYMAILLFCIGGFAHQMISVLITTLSADVFAPAEVGTAVGFVGQFGWLGGLSFSLVIGQLADRIGFAPLFGCLPVFDLVAAAVLIAMWGRLRAAAARGD